MPEGVKVKRRNLCEKIIKKYIDAGGVHCPYCKGENRQFSSIEVEGGGAHQQIECIDCGARWADSYLLVGIVELEKPTQGGADDLEHERVDFHHEHFNKIKGG